ncbi:beta-1,3-glucanase family protein [Paludibaculum fermentans]|uniref:GH64 domain-containing protein n=1 Tax=Paludibaculum fermentans TaxID=1473598 RepID=A0A7S7NLQ1_PALFE|nr:beta-1,3-glucanase family protein [Paludibaculum fermentans]QOY85879.1 hypothetical protein IRI77_24070 [Paludibaculum fermentans]
MRTSNKLAALIVLPFLGVLQADTVAPVLLKFANLRPDASTLPAYVSFGGGGVLTAVNLADHTPLAKGVAYRLTDLSAGVALSHFNSGRIYFSLGSPLTTANSSNGYSPNFANPSLPDFSTRWDKVEIDLDSAETGLAGGANLSAQDFFGIPLQIDSDGGRFAPAHLTWRETTANAFTALGALTSYAVSSRQNATGAIGLGEYGVTIPQVSGGSIVRIISPASVAPTSASGATVYKSLASYVTYLKTGSRTNPGQPVQTEIRGHNGQISKGGPFQSYNLTASLYNTPTTIAGTAIAAGDLVMQGTVNSGSGDLPLVIRVPAVNLTDHAIYGANPDWTLLAGTNANSIVEKVTADYFAALDLGLAGSTIDNPAQPGTAIGDSPSWTWYGNRPDGTDQPRLLITDAFSSAEPSHDDRYMQYAAYLTSISDAYGFAYNDRLQSPLASFTDGATVTLSILPDTQAPQASGPAEITAHSVATREIASPAVPGSVIAIHGGVPVSAQFRAPGVQVPLPYSLGGLTARWNGSVAAPILLVRPDEALIQIPWELQGQASAGLQLVGRTQATEVETVSLAHAAPELFALNGHGSGQGLIYSRDSQLADASNPAWPGSEVVLYCTGLGAVNHQPRTGEPAPSSPRAGTLSRPRVWVHGVEAVVLDSGLTPGEVGRYEISFLVPEGVSSGRAVPVAVEADGVMSNTVTLAITGRRRGSR